MTGEVATPADAYKALSVMLAYPTEDTVEAMRTYLGIEAEIASLRQRYQETFGGPVPGALPPLETEYDQPHVFAKAQTLADLAGFYRAFGLEMTGGLHRADHLAVEFEFAHVLAAKEAWAQERGQAERAGLCREARRKWLEEHLAAWGVPYLSLVAAQTGDPYGHVAESARTFLVEECRQLEVVLPERPMTRAKVDPAGDPACAALGEAREP